MLLPVESLSKIYHLVDLSSRAKSVSYEVVAIYNETSFLIYDENTNPVTLLKIAGDSVIVGRVLV